MYLKKLRYRFEYKGCGNKIMNIVKNFFFFSFESSLRILQKREQVIIDIRVFVLSPVVLHN